MTVETDLLDEFLDEDDSETSVETVESDARRPWERDYTADEIAKREAMKARGEQLPNARKRNPKYRRSRLTDKDFQVMVFLARFKFSTSTQLSLLSGVSWRAMHNRMLGLEEKGVVTRTKPILGARVLWIVTKTGMIILEQKGLIDPEDVRLVQRDEVSASTVGHTLGINQTALWLMRGWPGESLPDVLRAGFGFNSLVTEYQMSLP